MRSPSFGSHSPLASAGAAPPAALGRRRNRRTWPWARTAACQSAVAAAFFSAATFSAAAFSAATRAAPTNDGSISTT